MMSQKSRTKEERFLLAFLDFLPDDCEDNDAFEVEINRYKVGIHAGLAEKGVDAISHQLVRANFFKKRGEENLSITRTGLQVARSLIE